MPAGVRTVLPALMIEEKTPKTGVFLILHYISFVIISSMQAININWKNNNKKDDKGRRR